VCTETEFTTRAFKFTRTHKIIEGDMTPSKSTVPYYSQYLDPTLWGFTVDVRGDL